MTTVSDNKKIKILLADDSLVFRRFLEDIFSGINEFEIVGEAKNGIEALDLLLKTQPDVLLLDLEMPIMDGMTTLQHLMIHLPTPTIIFSSLSEYGIPRAYDTLKNGAIDFLCKDFIFQKKNVKIFRTIIQDKVRFASRLKISAREPFTPPKGISCQQETVVFCEECGYRDIIKNRENSTTGIVSCKNCGDQIEINQFSKAKYIRNNFMTVLGGGKGSFCNLLEIIPSLDPQIGGAIIAIVHEKSTYIDTFAEYLDSISSLNVIRAQQGTTIEGGCCYLISGTDYMSLKPYSAQLVLQKTKKPHQNVGAIDIILASVSSTFKKRAAGYVLSGEVTDGLKGAEILYNNGGSFAVLAKEQCYYKSMGQHFISANRQIRMLPTSRIVEEVTKLHSRAKENVIAG